MAFFPTAFVPATVANAASSSAPAVLVACFAATPVTAARTLSAIFRVSAAPSFVARCSPAFSPSVVSAWRAIRMPAESPVVARAFAAAESLPAAVVFFSFSRVATTVVSRRSLTFCASVFFPPGVAPERAEVFFFDSAFSESAFFAADVVRFAGSPDFSSYDGALIVAAAGRLPPVALGFSDLSLRFPDSRFAAAFLSADVFFSDAAFFSEAFSDAALFADALLPDATFSVVFFSELAFSEVAFFSLAALEVVFFSEVFVSVTAFFPAVVFFSVVAFFSVADLVPVFFSVLFFSVLFFSDAPESEPPLFPPAGLLLPPFSTPCPATTGTATAADAGEAARKAAPTHSTTTAPASPRTQRITHSNRSSGDSRSRTTASERTARPAASPSRTDTGLMTEAPDDSPDESGQGDRTEWQSRTRPADHHGDMQGHAERRAPHVAPEAATHNRTVELTPSSPCDPATRPVALRQQPARTAPQPRP
ncbi:hypothetical protein [Pseudonocardia alaniniphila]|uniref:hypothetical protein n=1 Tax=Pseudonocardia alaniniphila TaxID=75291 RepID=UPI0031D2A7F0